MLYLSALSRDRLLDVIEKTRGVMIIPLNNSERHFILALNEDRQDKTKCPKSHWEMWRALFRDYNAPHSIYSWELMNLDDRLYYGGACHLTGLQALQCMTMHMVKKNWIPIWAPDGMTKESAWEEVCALPEIFFARLQNELAKFTKLIPPAITIPGENLENDEKAFLKAYAKDRNIEDALKTLDKVGDRALLEEGCITEPTVEIDTDAFFLLRPKKKLSDPDTYTFVKACGILEDQMTLIDRFDERNWTHGVWNCAHGWHKYIKLLPGGDAIPADFLAGYEKNIKAKRETRDPTFKHIEDLKQAGDKKTRDAMNAFLSGGFYERPSKRARIE